jgi:hypothetical protein
VAVDADRIIPLLTNLRISLSRTHRPRLGSLLTGPAKRMVVDTHSLAACQPDRRLTINTPAKKPTLRPFDLSTFRPFLWLAAGSRLTSNPIPCSAPRFNFETISEVWPERPACQVNRVHSASTPASGPAESLALVGYGRYSLLPRCQPALNNTRPALFQQFPQLREREPAFCLPGCGHTLKPPACPFPHHPPTSELAWRPAPLNPADKSRARGRSR